MDVNMVSVALEEYELMKDAKYRLYVSAVDKALKAFDSTNEWPDLISALGKLNKVIKEHQRYPVIPRRIKISKRLAQCMHFALPAGVHLKALEVYDTIFKCMGTNRLSHELFIYSAGIFPLLGNSAINVKPPLLTVYETHFVPLGERLLPGLSGFLSGVLPGVEEGSDHFERTNSLLEKVCDGVGPSSFYGCLWEGVAGNPAVRLPAITFVLSHFNKKLCMEDQLYVMGTSVDIMVKALCAGVQDSNVLVQRSSLDLLLVGFPMHNSQLIAPDMVLLVTAALTTILRRDMSLNRRLCAWLLGSEVDINALPQDHTLRRRIEESGTALRSSIYFEIYSRSFLIQGVKETLRQGGTDIRPYRLLTSLLDKADIGPVILDDILFDVFRLLYLTCKVEDKLESPKRKVEILKSANLFFSSLEPWSIWMFLGSVFDQACMINSKNKTTVTEVEPVEFDVREVGVGPPGLKEICTITEFLLNVIPVELNLESPGEHLMKFLLRLIDLFSKYIDSLSPDQVTLCLQVNRLILKKLQLSRLKVKIEPTPDPEQDKPGEIIRPAVIRAMIGRPSLASTEPKVEISNIPPPHLEYKQATESTALFRSFLKDFQEFFVLLVGNGRILNSVCVPKAFDLLRKPSVRKNEKRNDYADELRRLLTTVVTENAEGKQNTCEDGSTDAAAMDLIVSGNEKWCDSFEIASLILVEASLFPSFVFDPAGDASQTPSWLVSLLVCCCYLKETPRLQMTAIRALLELFKMSETSGDEEDRSVAIGSSEICYFHMNTTIFKVITETLWHHLGQLGSDLQVLCIQLLHRLDNILLSDDCVERILGEILLRGDEAVRVDSLMRFINLWTVGRELQDGRQKRCFQSCLLKILDNLLLPDNSPLRLLTEAWLGQALMRGDIARLLDPLLVILLDPATARMGILHVSIQHPVPDVSTEDNSLEDTSKIYAISSVDGNVIYHVSDDSLDKNSFQKRLKWRWKKKETPAEQRVYAVTSLKNNTDSQLRYVTEKNVSRDIELPRPSNSQVSLFVNPFSGKDVEDVQSDSTQPLNEIIKSARRLIAPVRDAVIETISPRVTLELSTDTETTPSEVKFHYKKLSDNEGEDTLSASEYFGAKSESASANIARDMVDLIIDAAIRKSEGKGENRGVGVHPLHSHLLLYCGVYDSTRTLYAFKTLKNALFTNPRLFLCCSATSGIVNASFPSELLVLLARHRKSVFGRSFDGEILSLSEYVATYRSSMYLEVIVSVCLYFSRSYYPNLGLPRLTSDVLEGNRLVQLTSIETLTHVFTELLPIIRDSGRGFARYIADMLSRCKVQKIVLHCLMSCLSSVPRQQNIHCSRTFTEEIIEFNDSLDQNALSEHSRTLQMQLLKLVLALIKLEHFVEAHRSESPDGSSQGIGTKDISGSAHEASYTAGFLIPQQPMFLRAIVSALTLKGTMRMLHSHWTDMVTASLPYLGSALPQIVMVVVNQLCISIEELATIYASSISCEELPPDYAVTQLEALTVLCHYCVLDSTQQVSPLYLSSGNGGNISGLSGPNPGQILNNLVHVFTPIPLIQELSKDKNQQLEAMLTVRRSMLGRMPRIIASLAALWTAVAENPAVDEITIWGSLRVVRSQILEFLSPISLHHGSCFLAAIAVAWQERKASNPKQVLPVPTTQQEVLVHLVSSIRVMPIDTFVQTVHLVLKQPPAVQGALQDTCLEVSVLELFYVYMQTATGTQLRECWGSLLALLRDGLLLSPPALFLVLAILNEFVQRSTAFQDKKDQRDLQDITAKLVEACGAVAGACLEQTTWLRKTHLAVKDLDSVDDESGTGSGGSIQQHSFQAQLVLAQILAPLLDVSYGSQEKEKVAAVLIALMYNVTPYLKNHHARHASSFQACSQLLANLSGFPYTRKAWKKDAFELLLEPTLFQMDEECLPFWTTIVDNLMTHDQTTFRDLMSRISVAQSGSYNLFSSREQEYEQRAQLLKRLAFVIMCSEMDQYSKLMPSIQERLTESLRLPQVVPSIQAQVFFCFRVLLMRMSPHHVTFLWPTIISEMVQVFMHIEQELTTDTEEFSSHIRTMSALDSSWVVNSSNGLNAHGHPHWLLLILAASKLLDLVVLLPANHLPQFQMYRWAFVGDCNYSRKSDAVGAPTFIPHVMRILKLMDEKYGPCELYLRPKEGQLLLTESHINSLQQLHSFFHSLLYRPKSTVVDLASVEESIRRDFLEKMASSPIS